MPAERAASSARRHWPLALGGLIVVLVGSVAFATLHGSAANKSDPLSSARGTTGTSTASTGPVAFVSSSPASGTSGIDYSAPITVDFSAPLASDTPLPSIAPAVPGSWAVHGSALVFTPTGFYAPSTKETVTVPATVRSKDGMTLGAPVTTTFTVKPGSIDRLQQLLAELNYLPVNFTPTGNGSTAARAAAALDAEPTDPGLVSPLPANGTFNWRFASIPAQLAANWTDGEWNVATQGAVIAFEADHNLTLDGEPGPAVWRALLSAVADRTVSPRPYDYLLVTETLPETLYVWRDGGVIFQTPVNTGVSEAPTPLGTWPVYLRFTSTTMTGTNPDGTHYSDPGVPFVSYFHGSDAVHGFWRSDYGYPQSVGCVEVPIYNGAAATIYPTDPYGTLVTVTTGNLSSELGVGGPSTVAPPAPPASGPVATTPTTTPHPTTTTTTVPARHHPTRTTVPPTTVAPTTSSTTTTVAPTTSSTTTTLPPTTSSTSTTTTVAPTTTTT